MLVKAVPSQFKHKGFAKNVFQIFLQNTDTNRAFENKLNIMIKCKRKANTKSSAGQHGPPNNVKVGSGA
jgi:hypothetical protein